MTNSYMNAMWTMILLGPWTEFYFFAKSVPLLIFAGIGVIVIGFMIVCWFLNKWESFVKRINAKKIKEEDDGERSDRNDESSS